MKGQNLGSRWRAGTGRFEGISIKDYLTLKNKEIDPSKYLEMAGLHPVLYLNRMMDCTLSGGERKRIELASVVAFIPGLSSLMSRTLA